MSTLHLQHKWIASGRNGYTAVDCYGPNGMERNATYGKSKKHAEEIAGACGSAYYDGLMDAHIGLTLPLVRPVEFRRDILVTVTAPAGTLVTVLSRSGAWFKVETASCPAFPGRHPVDEKFQFQVQRTDLRNTSPDNEVREY